MLDSQHGDRALRDEARIRRVELPDSRAPGGFAVTTTVHDFGNFDARTTFRTRVTDANNNARASHRDVQQNIVGIEEVNTIAGTDRTLITRYAYNPVNELTKVTDAKNFETTASYDSVGRMVSLISRDMGETQWRFDRSGNLAAKQTAKLRAQNQLVRYEYDFNRLRRIDYPVSPPVVYSYGTKDQRGDAFGNIAGRIATETSEGGLKELRYDRLGNVAQHTMTWERIRTPELDPYSATMRYQYDSFSRLLTMQFPGLGEEVVSYGYDRGGLVTSAFGVRSEVKRPQDPLLTFYLLGIGYDHFGQRTRVIYGNGVESYYRYDPLTRRLVDIDSDHQPLPPPPKNQDPRPFQRLRYEHDLVGNLLSIRNQAPFDNQLNDVFVATTQQSFRYDKLYQLVQADGIYQDESKSRERYSLGFGYDEIGNILVKDQASFRDLPDKNGNWVPDRPDAEQTYRSVYNYGGPRPHAPTLITETLIDNQVRDRELSYDASGNQTGWIYHHSERREVDWNEEDRISEIRKGGQKLTRVAYDGSGERAVHVSYFGNHETAYLGQNLSIRNGELPSKHVYAGNVLIASKLDPEWFPHPPTLYFHPDHLGSAHYATNDVQELTQHDEYFPTGEIWQSQTEGRYSNRRLTTYTGKELDEGTGLYYFGARWYNPRLSQWTSPDPALADYFRGDGHFGGIYATGHLSSYSYALNSPMQLTDPNGRQEGLTLCVLGPVGCAGGGAYEVIKWSIVGVGALTVVVGGAYVVKTQGKSDPPPAPTPTPDPTPETKPEPPEPPTPTPPVSPEAAAAAAAAANAAGNSPGGRQALQQGAQLLAQAARIVLTAGRNFKDHFITKRYPRRTGAEDDVRQVQRRRRRAVPGQPQRGHQQGHLQAHRPGNPQEGRRGHEHLPG